MPETLAAVTRRFSQRLNRLNRWFDARSARLDSERLADLSRLPSAVALLSELDERVARARERRDQSVAGARRQHAENRRQAIESRAGRLAALAERYADDQQSARESRAESERRARELYEAEVDRARGRGIDEAYLKAVDAARKKRDRALDAALAAFDRSGRRDRQGYTRAVEAAGKAQSVALIAADGALAEAIEAADDAAAAAMKEAVKLRDRALAALAEAKPVERAYRSGLRALRAERRARQESIEQQLREEIGALPA